MSANDSLTPEMASKLDDFINSFPLPSPDEIKRERFYDFVIQAHKDDSDFSHEDLFEKLGEKISADEIKDDFCKRYLACRGVLKRLREA